MAAQSLYRYVPAFESLRGYSIAYLYRDLFAGLTVAAVAVPQAMAYASIFGVPVQYGLYTAIVMTAVGASSPPTNRRVVSRSPGVEVTTRRVTGARPTLDTTRRSMALLGSGPPAHRDLTVCRRRAVLPGSRSG